MFLSIQQLPELEESHKCHLPDGGTSEIFIKELTVYLEQLKTLPTTVTTKKLQAFISKSLTWNVFWETFKDTASQKYTGSKYRY